MMEGFGSGFLGKMIWCWKTKTELELGLGFWRKRRRLEKARAKENIETTAAKTTTSLDSCKEKKMLLLRLLLAWSVDSASYT